VTVKAVVFGRDDRAAFEYAAQALDVGRGPAGEVAQSAFTDLALVAKALAQEDGGWRAPVRDGFDIHVLNRNIFPCKYSNKRVITWLRF
jgi:hypothetical protein